MRSARRQKLASKKRKGSLHAFLKFFYPALVLAMAWLYLAVNVKYWNGADKFDYVFKNKDGDVVVKVLDPKLTDSLAIVIPGETEVGVARNLGTMQIKNVWQLGINEKLNGDLMAATVTKNFLTPVFLWSDQDIEALDSFNIPGIVKFIVAPSKTNIPVGDRAVLALFSLRVKGIDRTTIDLGKSQFLKKAKLNDGQVGYILGGPVSGRLTANFSDTDFSGQNVRVAVQDATGTHGTANTVGQIIEIMGGKVVSINKTAEDPESDCIVSGINPKVVKKTAALFGCRVSNDPSIFDLEIKIGSLFAKRY